MGETAAGTQQGVIPWVPGAQGIGNYSRLNDVPPDSHILISGTYECYLLRQREFQDVITLRILRWENYPVYSDGPDVIL